MLVLTQSQQMVINAEYVDCMLIGKEIIDFSTSLCNNP